MAQCHNCKAPNEYHEFTGKVDKSIEERAIKGLDAIAHDVEDIIIEEDNENN